MENLTGNDIPHWAKQIEVFKRDEHNNKRQIAGPRNYVSEAKTYKFTRGFHQRGNNRGYYGNQRGNQDFRRPNDYNRRYTQNRNMVPRDEMQDEIEKAKKMERYIQLAGEHARDNRNYGDDYSDRSNLSFHGNESDDRSMIFERTERPESAVSQADSLEFDIDEQTKLKEQGKPENKEEETKEQQ